MSDDRREDGGPVEVLDEEADLAQLRRQERVMLAMQLRYVDHLSYVEVRRILAKRFGVHRSKAEAYLNLAKKVWLAKVREELKALPAEQLAGFERQIARLEKRQDDLARQIERAEAGGDFLAVAALSRVYQQTSLTIRAHRAEINRMFGLNAPKRIEGQVDVDVGGTVKLKLTTAAQRGRIAELLDKARQRAAKEREADALPEPGGDDPN